jgi:hypothetical protein
MAAAAVAVASVALPNREELVAEALVVGINVDALGASGNNLW